MTELEPRAGEELERRLGRYARLRLEPSQAQQKRARSAVMEAAWRQKLQGTVFAPDPVVPPLDDSFAAPAGMTLLPPPATAPVAAPVSSGRGLFGGWGVRRLGTSFAAAVLAGLMVGSSVFAASRAGGPLYTTRIALEELTLPTDAQARLEAELGLAQVRIGEVVEGVNRGDQAAAAAALTAYLAALDDLDDSTGGPADRALLVIQGHRKVLESVLARVPEQARSGIENALAQSSKVIERLDAAATPAPTDAGTGNGNGNGNGNGTGPGGGATTGGTSPNPGTGANGGNGGQNPNAGGGSTNGNGDKPDPTPKPARTPKPAKTPPPAPVETNDATTKAPQGGKP